MLQEQFQELNYSVNERQTRDKVSRSNGGGPSCALGDLGKGVTFVASAHELVWDPHPHTYLTGISTCKCYLYCSRRPPSSVYPVEAMGKDMTKLWKYREDMEPSRNTLWPSVLYFCMHIHLLVDDRNTIMSLLFISFSLLVF